MTSTIELMDHPRIKSGTDEQGRQFVAYDMKGFGPDVVGTYWRNPRPTDLDPRQSWDGWLYTVPGVLMGQRDETYSHVTEQGCQIMILQHFVETGILAPTPANEHLDDRNRGIASEIEAARETFTGQPRVGDFVRLPDGRMKRCASETGYGMQLCDGGSFSITTGGRASMSGSLDPSQLWEYFCDTGETQPGRFWFFSHGIAGAGRGVDVYLPCRVYDLKPFEMTEEQARAHPMAIRSAEFWGENDRGHLETITKLMNVGATA